MWSLTSGTATPGSEPPKVWKPFSSVRSNGTEKTRDALDIEDVSECSTARPGSLRAKGLVGHLRERGLVGGRVQHAVEFGLLAAFGGGLETAARSWRRRARKRARWMSGERGEAGSGLKSAR